MENDSYHFNSETILDSLNSISNLSGHHDSLNFSFGNAQYTISLENVMDNSTADLNTLKLYCNDEISRFFSEENVEEQERKAEEEFITLLAQF